MKRSIYTRKRAAVKSYSLLVLLAVSAFCSISTAFGQTTYTDFNAGAAIINMGISPQTDNNGLKPYELVAALIDEGIPVYWIINPDKDFGSDKETYLAMLIASI